MRWQSMVAIAIAWFVGLYACVRIEQSSVQLYITISIFIFIAKNLGQRRDGLSAYSVFNSGFIPLLGQLQPDQFENEIRHRPIDGDSNNHHTTTTTRPRNSNTNMLTEGMDEHDRILQSMRAEIQRDARRRKVQSSSTSTTRPTRKR